MLLASSASDRLTGVGTSQRRQDDHRQVLIRWPGAAKGLGTDRKASGNVAQCLGANGLVDRGIRACGYAAQCIRCNVVTDYRGFS
jgi:hypothetical protein